MNNYQDIVNQVCSDNRYLHYCKKITGGQDIHNDLYQEFVIRFLSQPKEKVFDMFSKPSFIFDLWSIRVIKNMFINKYDPFYKKYRTITHEIDDSLSVQDETDDPIDCKLQKYYEAEDRLSNDSYTNMIKKIFKLHVKLGSYRKVADELSTDTLSVSHTSIKKFCDEYKELVRENTNLCEC